MPEGPFFQIRTQMKLQLSGCFSATNICKHNVFHMRFYVYATQKSFQQGKSLNLKICKSINLQTIHRYGQSLKKVKS